MNDIIDLLKQQQERENERRKMRKRLIKKPSIVVSHKGVNLTDEFMLFIKYGEDNSNPYTQLIKQKAVEVGNKLYALGGHDLMVSFFKLVKAYVCIHTLKDLEWAWNGIGDWRV